MWHWRHNQGQVQLGFTDSSTDLATADPNKLATVLGVNRVVMMHQVHGCDVVVVDHDYLARLDAGASLIASDAAITGIESVALCVRTADCVPIILADPAHSIIAVAHAGRKGMHDGVIPAVVVGMRTLGAESIMAWLGPHICGSCYEVPQEMADAVANRFPITRSTTSWGTPALDIAAGCRAQLVDHGCEVSQLEACTLQDQRLPSYRRSGAAAGRMGGLVWTI